MSEKKNIERLFQEKFKDFEAIPSPEVWDNIEAKLKEKKKRRVIPLWFKLSGVAAILLIGFMIGDGIINSPIKTDTDNGVVDQNATDVDRSKDLTPMQSPIKSKEVVTENENAVTETKNTDLEKNNPTQQHKNSENPEQDQLNKSIISGKNKAKNTAIASQDNTDRERLKNTADKNLPVITNQKTKTESGLASQGPAQQHNRPKNANQNKFNGKNQEDVFNKAGIADSGNKEKNQAKSIINQNSNKISIPENRNEGEKQLAVSEKKSNDLLRKNDNVSERNKQSDKEKNNNSRIAFDTEAFEKQKKDSAAVATAEPNPLEELLKEKEKKQQAVTETKVNRWQITSNVAPIYFSSASKGSPINQQFADNSKSYEKNLSYGVGVNYAINKKWSIRGGVNKLTLGYNTNNIVYYAGLSDAVANGEVFSPSNIQESRNVTVIVEDNTAANTVSFDNVPGKKAGSLNQTMGYVEVPVELSYKILDDKFGISLIGGMSTLFLNENSLSVVSPGMSTSIGKASNLNDVSFTSNIGIGFKYKFWKSFEANVEPKLKYQINTFSENAGGFKPYFIGLYSGISFNF
ncbi:MAG: hypothetical protein BGO88_13685 [Flavobacterium sp. 38-13]|uniref:outer membrane beta-barrel protein n=1 Tax=Flavobacterium sp. 38-13 TaxID=1896168 RepID=UPI000969D7D2|nr:outer membrane beta-barrel protein [Flavobacterium sp. 38-13]OJX52861.1 MAG: hypothetical protein BGO88_13685 [Flavobacterium sp. 38-13]